MGKNPENFEFIECPECEGTGVDKSIPVPYWDEELDKNIESIEDYPESMRHEFCCGKCQGAQDIEVDDDEREQDHDFIYQQHNDFN